MSMDPAYIGVIVLGILHGLEPGHGWPIALLYSMKKSKPLLYGFYGSTVISFFHFISSIALVAVYALVNYFFSISTSLFRYVAACMLVILACVFFKEDVADDLKNQHDHVHENSEEIEHEHEHTHPGQESHTHMHKHKQRLFFSLLGIATFAFFLGFAHEEEFALLALAVGDVNPLLLMISYGVSVTLALIGITLLSIEAYGKIQPKIAQYEKYIPKISGLILLVMAIALVLNVG